MVWSRRQPLANVGAVLSLLDGPTGCDPAFCVVWFRFRLLRRYLALWPAEVGRVYRLLEMVGDGCPGHGPIHFLSSSAAEIGFQWDPVALASLILLIFEKEIRVCFGVSWLGVFGMVSCWVVFAIRLLLVGSVVLLIMMVICFGIVPFHLLLRSVKILSFTIS